MTGTLLDPEMAGAGAGRIAAAAQAAQETVPGLIERIGALCAAKPWGHDGPGLAVDEQFSSVPVTCEEARKNLAAISVVGQVLQQGVVRTVDTDVAARDRLVAASIDAALPQ